MAGQYDPLTSLDDTIAVFEEVAGPKELWVLENEFHGSGRGSVGIEGLGGLAVFPSLADWLNDALYGRHGAELNRKIFIRKNQGLGPYEQPVRDYALETLFAGSDRVAVIDEELP